jgi:hypothetical protein
MRKVSVLNLAVFFLVVVSFVPFLLPEIISVMLAVIIIGVALLFGLCEKQSRSKVLKGSAIFCLLLFLSFPSYLLSAEPAILLPAVFFILPFMLWLSLARYFDALMPTYFLALKVGTVLVVAGILIQIFVDPNLFGIKGHPVYGGDKYGTTSFRPTGFSGSPQNVALLLGVGLFLQYSQSLIINFFIRLAIIFAGAQTLATFFFGALCLYIVSKTSFAGFLVVIIAFVLIWSADFANTGLEFMSVSELGKSNERYLVETFWERPVVNLLFGYGPGTATQGMIDRGYVSANLYEAESVVLVLLHEYGLIFIMSLISVVVWKAVAFSKKNQHEVFSNFIWMFTVLGASLLLTPNFSSFRIKVLLLPLCLIPFFYRSGMQRP